MKIDGTLIIVLGVLLAFGQTLVILLALIAGIKLPMEAYFLYLVPATIICIGEDMTKK